MVVMWCAWIWLASFLLVLFAVIVMLSYVCRTSLQVFPPYGDEGQRVAQHERLEAGPLVAASPPVGSVSHRRNEDE